MNTHDSADSNAQGSSGGGPFPHPDWVGGSDAAAGPRSGRHTIIGGLARDWWRILLVWVLVSTPMAYLIYTLAEPTFEATSLLQVEPTIGDLYSVPVQRTPALEDVRPYLLTQVSLLTSDAVLDAALASPAIRNLPMIRSSKDPKAELRDEMRVEIVGENTYLIQVALAARDPNQATAIVNAVVDAYLEQHARYHRTKNRSLKMNLESELAKLDKKIAYTLKELADLAKRTNVAVAMRLAVGAGDKAVVSSLQSVSEEQYKAMTDRLLHADFELMDAEARLETARRPESQASAEKLRELESAVEEAKRKRTSYTHYIAQLKVESRLPNTEMHEASLTEDMLYLKKLRETVQQRLGQLEFEIGQEAYRVTVQDKARVPRTPSNNKRIKYMAAAPVGALFLILGMFLVRELRATRGAAPEAMS